jgi:N-acetylneuraminic acid mutarotase
MIGILLWATLIAGESLVTPFTELPEPIASFGGATLDGWLYVYGGHLGTPHAHSRDNLSGEFRRLNLAEGTWQSLPAGPPLQGMPLVECGGKLIRVGGLSANNKSGEPADLHSVASVGVFDPATSTWKDGPALPRGRSSHDAAVVGSVIYVVGGWHVDGTEGDWLDNTLAWDTAVEPAAWKEIAKPPFRRRAISCAATPSKLYVIGGMDEDNKPSSQVDVLDLSAGTWSKGPDLPVEGMKGFGVATIAVGEAVYASGLDKKILRMTPASSQWEVVAQLAEPRIFHRLLPAELGTILVIGGADGFQSQTASIAKLRLP